MSDARSLTHALGGRWYRTYGMAFCPAHPNTRTPALSLSDGKDGRLLAYCHAGCSFDSVMDALRQRGLLSELSDPAPPSDLTARPKAAEDRSRSKRAMRLWSEAIAIEGSPAEQYLRERAITCLLPETVRFHPACWHSSGQRLPAMIARVDRTIGFAVHRTYLASDGRGKADVAPTKAMLGPCAGGAVILSQGPGPLIVTEGIETGLSLLCKPFVIHGGVHAALSTAGIRSFRLPDTAGALIIAPDGDPPGKVAAHALATRADALGWTVSLLEAPTGKDWNDVLREKAVAA